MNNNHFAHVFSDCHELGHEEHSIEKGQENTADEYLEQQKKKRLLLKDELFAMIKKHKEVA